MNEKWGYGNLKFLRTSFSLQYLIFLFLHFHHHQAIWLHFLPSGMTWYTAQNIDRQDVKIVTVGFTATQELTNLRLISSQPQMVKSHIFINAIDSAVFSLPEVKKL